MVQLQSVEAKITIYKNVHYLKALPKYTDINVSNDLTKTERAREKELWEEAKKMNDKDDSGDFKCKMGQESGQDKEVKWNKRTNLVHSGKNVLNSVNVNTFTVLSKLNCSYTNADQLFNKMAERIAELEIVNQTS